MTKKRRLTDLYVRGREEVFDDGSGDPIVVWVQKPNPVDHEDILRRANAARSRRVAVLKDEQSDGYQAILTEMREMFKSRDEQIDYLVGIAMNPLLSPTEAEIAAEEEWSKDNYLQGLQDAWDNGGVRERYHLDKEDEEAQHIFNELKRFADQVEHALEDERASARESFESKSDSDLEYLVVEKLLEHQGTMAWLQEYRRSQLLHAVRDSENHKQKYFENRAEIDSLTQEVFSRLIAVLDEINVDPVEGKDSEATPNS